MRELRNHSLAGMTTLGLGGPADRILDAASEQELEAALAQAERDEDPVLILGGGSNVIVDDGGWRGSVIRPAIRGIRVEKKERTVHLHVGAGEVWDDLVALCVGEGWSGLACLSGIPGWSGAAPIQNIGAYGHEVRGVLLDVRAFDRVHHGFTTFPCESCEFGYRASMFRQEERYVITQVTLVLRAGDESVRYPELARALGVEEGRGAPPSRVRETVLELRRGKGMVVDENDPESKSAGSFFVNPVVEERTLRDVEARAVQRGIVGAGSLVPRYDVTGGWFKIPAAWLIEKSGFAKGTTLGGVGISKKHALALVNRGGNTSELLRLERAIQQGVKETFGVALSREPILVGAPARSPTLP
jgi:UDP-N-acetylmuramate dehydrogenase